MKMYQLRRKAMARSRERKLKHFQSLCNEDEKVLDVGVSSEPKKMPSKNYFLKNYPYASHTYTGLGIDDLSDLEVDYPDKKFVQYPGGKFPFENKTFDWVFSNAVIEHVGDESEQLLFINEMMRVAKNVFFTTPNKYFPVEPHTNVFFLHWFNKPFYHWCVDHRPWIDRKSLNLLSAYRLKKLMKQSTASSFKTLSNMFYGLPMTFTVICSDNEGTSYKQLR